METTLTDEIEGAPALWVVRVKLSDVTARSRLDAASREPASLRGLTRSSDGAFQPGLFSEPPGPRRGHRGIEGAGAFFLVVVGIDRLKSVVENLGPFAGDRLLVATARRLGSFVRQDDVVARIADDEFALLLSGLSDLETFRGMGGRLRDVLEAPVMLDGHR